ncbi:MAG: DNA polymerase III subunit alpha [Propionibacteriaceae bacterium]|nr:DNA polymerase III subunit alpha [Propionibacteriaceae bacterium]
MFTHLRVASGYSFQYGASHPSALVAEAARHGMDALAITDRGGLYGAVRFAKACLQAGIAPIVGVDLAVRPDGWLARRRPTAARGGQLRDERLPRVVVLATSRAGWGVLCQLITAAQTTGERGDPVVTREIIAQHCAGRDVVVLMGADSQVGELLAAERPREAAEEVRAWRTELGEGLFLAATNHQTGGRGVASAHHAAGMIRLADPVGVPVVLTNMVRMARREQAATVDVLDAARRLVPLDVRNIDRRNAEGHLKNEAGMVLAAGEASLLAGRSDATALLAATRGLAERCMLDPIGDIGLGEIRLPEFETLGTTVEEAPAVLRARCEAGLAERYGTPSEETLDRLTDELAVIGTLGFESYFLTVADVVGLIREMGIRCAARGSGAGSLVNYALGISGVDPMKYGLLMERFLSPLRVALPDIDLDVESARRTEVYDRILATFGSQRVACVAMIETYRVRHAVRDVGAALSLPPVEIDAMAKAFPHIRARDARAALRDLPELRAVGLGEERLDVLFSLVESLDGLPRHIALHPCGVLLSDSSLGQRTPMENSFGGYPMSQFDKDDVEDLGFLKLDVLGIRMQSAMAHALTEIERTIGPAPDIDALAPFDDEAVYEMIAHRQTLGCFQIESPGQRELVGKFGPENFHDIIVDISLFRPGPVKSDMVTPFLEARQGWAEPEYLHPSLIPALEQTCGVVVFHEQIIQIISIVTGCSLAQGDEVRRALGDREGQAKVKEWFVPKAMANGYEEKLCEEIWFILESFASFGFCKAHAAAFALPTYQSAWLKRHYPAHFLAGILTHDPGMYPKRLLLEEARRMDLEILGLDINRSQREYRAELGSTSEGWGIRLSLADVKGISEEEMGQIISAAPYLSLTDFWSRANVSEPVVERLILAGAFDSLYGIGRHASVQRRQQVTRRDLLLALADLHRERRANSRVGALQGAFTFGEEETEPTADVTPTGLAEMDDEQRLKAELEILGLDASHHIMERYLPLLRALGVTASSQLLERRNREEVLVAGVKVATQTPPVRSGRRVIFLTLDDSTGPVDTTFFEDVQGPYAATVFSSWILLARGLIRRTGPRGISIRATGAWDLGLLDATWREAQEHGATEAEALAAVTAILDEVPEGYSLVGEWKPAEQPAAPQTEELPADGEEPPPDPQNHTRAGGMGRRRVLVHASGFKQSPYSDIKPAGTGAADAPRKLWHSSPGSSGR